jgi:hypothetical protein
LKGEINAPVETPEGDRRMTEPIALFPDDQDWRSLPVHPAAAAFRMMTEDELQQLAADIKVNGLVYPIVRGDWKEDDQSVRGIIDGRNRLRACEIAKVEPSFTEFKGDDPRDFIVSVNGERRNVTIGQKAMAYALIFPEPEQTGGGRGKTHFDRNKFMRPKISDARTVIKYAPELVERVKSGIITLDNAHHQAAERKNAEEWLEDGMRRLRELAADLAARVDAGDISFDEARTLLNERENEAREVRATTYQSLREFLRNGQGFAQGTRFLELPDWLKIEEYESEFRRYFPGGIKELTAAGEFLNEGAAAVNRVLAQLKRGKK